MQFFLPSTLLIYHYIYHNLETINSVVIISKHWISVSVHKYLSGISIKSVQ